MLQFGCLTSFGSITWDTQFCQIWDWCEISVTILVFILDYFQEKLTIKVFKKSKKPYFGGHFVSQIWLKINFRGNRALSLFKYSNYLPWCQKSEKTNEPFLRKMLNWWMGTGRQQWFYRTLFRMGVQWL